jgi:hypothetical protein
MRAADAVKHAYKGNAWERIFPFQAGSFKTRTSSLET